MKSRGCAKPTIELVQTQWQVWSTPYFSSSPPRFWVLDFAASVYFLLVETVQRIIKINSKSIQQIIKLGTINVLRDLKRPQKTVVRLTVKVNRYLYSMHYEIKYSAECINFSWTGLKCRLICISASPYLPQALRAPFWYRLLDKKSWPLWPTAWHIGSLQRQVAFFPWSGVFLSDSSWVDFLRVVGMIFF